MLHQARHVSTWTATINVMQPRQPAGIAIGGQFASTPLAEMPASQDHLSLDGDDAPPPQKVQGPKWSAKLKGKIRGGKSISFSIETDAHGNETVVPSTAKEAAYYSLSRTIDKSYYTSGEYSRDRLGLAVRAGSIVSEMLQNGEIEPTGAAVDATLKAVTSVHGSQTSDRFRLSICLAVTRRISGLENELAMQKVQYGVTKKGGWSKLNGFPINNMFSAGQLCCAKNAWSVQRVLQHGIREFRILEDGSVTYPIKDGYFNLGDAPLSEGTHCGTTNEKAVYVGPDGKLLWNLLMEPSTLAYNKGTAVQFMLEKGENGVTNEADFVLMAALANDDVADHVVRSCLLSAKCVNGLLEKIATAATGNTKLWQNPNTRTRLLDLLVRSSDIDMSSRLSIADRDMTEVGYSARHAFRALYRRRMAQDSRKDSRATERALDALTDICERIEGARNRSLV